MSERIDESTARLIDHGEGAGALADCYLMGHLSRDEEAQFEEHFVDCEECLRQLELSEDFRANLRQVAATEAARGIARSGILAWLLKSRGWMALLIVAVLGPLATLLGISLTSTQDQAPVSAETTPARLAFNLPPGSDHERLPTYTLSAPRGTGTTTIQTRGDTSLLRLVIQKSDPDESYHLTLREAGGRTLSEERRVRPVPNGDIEFLFRPGVPAEGDYELHVERQGDAENGYSPQIFPFTIAANP